MTDVYVAGDVVPLTFYVTDEDGLPANATSAALTITKPDGSTVTPALTNTETGTYTNDYTATPVGRYIAVFVTTGTNAGTAVYVFDVQASNLSVVTLADVKTYLGTDISWTDPEIQSALDAERAAQARACHIDTFGPDLREALFRRVARNLAARAVPVAQFTQWEGGGTVSRVPLTDPEVRRLESPYRRLVVG